MPSPIDLILIGALLLALITVESGGWFLTRVVRGHAPANALQQSFFRAGHAHAAVLIVLSLVILSVLSATALEGVWLWIARLGVPVAAILMPAGFFLSVLGRDPERAPIIYRIRIEAVSGREAARNRSAVARPRPAASTAKAPVWWSHVLRPLQRPPRALR